MSDKPNKAIVVCFDVRPSDVVKLQWPVNEKDVLVIAQDLTDEEASMRYPDIVPNCIINGEVLIVSVRKRSGDCQVICGVYSDSYSGTLTATRVVVRDAIESDEEQPAFWSGSSREHETEIFDGLKLNDAIRFALSYTKQETP